MARTLPALLAAAVLQAPVGLGCAEPVPVLRGQASAPTLPPPLPSPVVFMGADAPASSDVPRIQPPGWFAANSLDPPVPVVDWTGPVPTGLAEHPADGLGRVVFGEPPADSEVPDSGNSFDPAGDGVTQTRPSMNISDMDYRSEDFSPAPCWNLRWLAGGRFATVYADSHACGMELKQRSTSNFVGVGPHAGIDLSHGLAFAPGVAAFGRLDGAFIVGDATPFYDENEVLPDDMLSGGANRLNSGLSVPVFGVQLGLAYTPLDPTSGLRFSFGYHFERWFGVGDLRNAEENLTVRGLFLRGEFHF